MRLSILIPTLRRPGLLEETLRNVTSLSRPPDEIVVVDGDLQRSAAAVVDRARAAGVPLTYLPSAPGAALQRNRGLERCSGDVVVFLDDDVTLDTDALAVLEGAYADESIVGATGVVDQPRQHRVDRDSWLRVLLPGGGREGTFTRYGYPRYLKDVGSRHDVEFMMGCFMSARRDAAAAVAFDERLTGSSIAEDEDFSRRLSELGRIVFLPEARCRHKLAASHEGDRQIARTTVVNRAYLFRKNFRPTPLARAQFALLVALMLVHRVVNRNWPSAAGVVAGAAAVVRGEHRRGTARAPVSVEFVGSHARRGGAERYLQNVVTHVEADVRGVVLLEDGPAAAALRSAGVAVDVLPTGPRGRHVIVSALRLRRRLRRTRPDVVHANGVKAALVAVLATRATSIPVVWVKHDHSFDGGLARHIARRCAFVVGVSASVVDALDGVPAHRVRVVTTGAAPVDADPVAARSALEAEVGPNAAAVVGLVGRLTPDKGADELLAIAPELVRRRPGVRIALVGGDDPSAPGYRSRLAAAAAGLNGHVSLLGHRDDAPVLLAGMDVVVIPSVARDGAQAEGFPLVAVEALQVGTPVVAYDTGGLRELLGDCGVLVPAGDRAALLEALDQLLGDGERRSRLARCGRSRARERYDVARMAGELVDCYRAAAGR